MSDFPGRWRDRSLFGKHDLQQTFKPAGFDLHHTQETFNFTSIYQKNIQGIKTLFTKSHIIIFF